MLRLLIGTDPLFRSAVHCLGRADTSFGAYALLRPLLDSWAHLWRTMNRGREQWDLPGASDRTRLGDCLCSESQSIEGSGRTGRIGSGRGTTARHQGAVRRRAVSGQNAHVRKSRRYLG